MPKFKLRPKEIVRLKTLFEVDPKNEVMAIGIINLDESDDNNVTLEDLFIPTQEVSGASCDIEGKEDMSALYHDMVVKDESTDKTRCWIHLHPSGMGTTPSGIDDTQQKYFLEDMNMDYMFMLIFGEKFPFGGCTCEVWYKSGHKLFGSEISVLKYDIELDLDNLHDGATDEDIEEMKRLHKERVSTKTYTVSKPYYYQYWKGNKNNAKSSHTPPYYPTGDPDIPANTKDGSSCGVCVTLVTGDKKVEVEYSIKEGITWADATAACDDIKILLEHVYPHSKVEEIDPQYVMNDKDIEALSDLPVLFELNVKYNDADVDEEPNEVVTYPLYAVDEGCAILEAVKFYEESIEMAISKDPALTTVVDTKSRDVLVGTEEFMKLINGVVA